jgi:hypothetical protein
MVVSGQLYNPTQLLHTQEITWYILDKQLGGPESWSYTFGEEKISSSWRDLNLGLFSWYTDYVTVAIVCWSKTKNVLNTIVKRARYNSQKLECKFVTLF